MEVNFLWATSKVLKQTKFLFFLGSERNKKKQKVMDLTLYESRHLLDGEKTQICLDVYQVLYELMP